MAEKDTSEIMDKLLASETTNTDILGGLVKKGLVHPGIHYIRTEAGDVILRLPMDVFRAAFGPEQ